MNNDNLIYQLQCLIDEMMIEGKTDREIADVLGLQIFHADLLPNLVGVIIKLDHELTLAYEEMAGEDI